jgi:hypothetical protein
MSEEAEVAIKVKKALQVILTPKARAPGVKGWELKRTVGKDYYSIIQVLSTELDKLGLVVKVAGEAGELPPQATTEQLDDARYYIIFKEPLSTREASPSGMSIDDMAALAIILSYLTSKRGKAPAKEVERMLKEKLPKWKVEWNMRRFIRRGYIIHNDDDTLSIGWRSLVEVDFKSLLTFLLATPPKEQEGES